ncbi:phage portal protein [Rhizobium rhizogenes]|uniref:phage portal protein n=1 Tax=Rhizobium rhizogenes TaxID=359 RepID=UPI0022BBDC96|nr:phage portal protein [Rhizobium rhizogenes]MCZ7466664.1 phage portal protein [Rhizobium rhizogenes]
MSIATVLDRTIGYFSPEAGLRRVKHRAAMEIMSRGYAGAETSRLKSGRRAPSTSADAEIARAGGILRNRMRDMVRNNPYAANAVAQLVSHAIGDGIVPRTKNKKAKKLFDEWCKHCDADGDLDFYGIQQLAAREMFESGNGIVRRRMQSRDGKRVPLKLQVLEVDLLDTAKDGLIAGGGKVIQGVEFDANGNKRAYWMFGAHPGNTFWDPERTAVSKPVDANDIAHMFEKQRTQGLGTPWGVPAMDDTYELAKYEEAERTRKRLEACMVGVMSGGEENDVLGSPVGADGKALPPGIYNVRGERVEKFEPGTFYNAVGGRSLNFSQPAATDSYDPYKVSMLHTIAAGWRMPYAILTGRLDKVNYSSGKIGMESFRRLISALQWQIIIPMLLQPIWDWFCEAAWTAGLLDQPNVPVVWCPPRFYSLDPLKETNAKVREVRAGFRTLPSVIAESGEDPDDVIAEAHRFKKKLDRLGLVFDTDPSIISQAGQLQPIKPNAPPDLDEDEDPDDDET